MKSIFRTAMLAIAFILSISVNGQEPTTRGTIQETGGNVVVYYETASWGQNYPFNEQCWTSYNGTTHAKTGCVATAYAIVLRYHCYPTKGTENILYNCQAPIYVEMTDRNYDWSNMPLVYDGNWNETQIYEVSKLMAHLAHANFSSFGSGATTANEERETARLNRYFNYPKIQASYQRDYTQEQWEAKIKESLDNGCPIPYAANNSGTGDSRHMFVIDGYTDNGYYHFNFGWNGSGNGWFKLNDITPYQGDNYSWNGNSEHYANFNLKPDVAKQSINVTVSPEEAGTVSINNGTAASNVTAELTEGSTATLTAVANEGYIFVNWTKDGEVAGTESTVKVTVGANNNYVANFIEYSGPTTAEYTISHTTGTLTNGTSKSSSWTFTKTSECPAELTLQSACGTTAVNAMSINSGILQLYAFDYDMQSGITYTLGVPSGFLITGYEVTYKMGSSYKITIENETMKQTATRSDQIFTASGLSTTSTSFNLTGTAANNFVKVTKFVVTVQKEGSPETGIKTIEIPVSESIYNLKGEKLDNITEPGIYIVNGKKILKR
jgi:hypothetical protein